MAKKTMKPGTMLNPLPVVMVSCGDEKEKNIITIAWTGIVNSEPPMTYVSIRKSRHSHNIVREKGEYVINIPTEELAKITDFCGVKSGRDIDKFKTLSLTSEKADIVSAPMIKEAPVNLECVVKNVIEYPSHDMFVAEIVKVHVDESLFDEKGKIHLENAGLICYSHGEYMPIKKRPLGRFGYSVMKPRTKKRLNRENNAKRHSKKRRG